MGVGWASGLWVLLPPSSSDLWGVCGRRRRLWKQEVRENELLNVFKVQAGSDVITVSVRGSGAGGRLCCFDNGPVSCRFPGCCFFGTSSLHWTLAPPPAL